MNAPARSATLGTAGSVSPAGLRAHTVQGGAVTAVAHALKFLLTLGSTLVLARLLTPADYGLVAMVMAFTGLVEILKDGGLSLATIQSRELDGAQATTLFWLNASLGLALALLTAALAPLVVRFYGEPRLAGITLALGGTFVFAGLGVQHLALLRRELRFKLIAAIEVGAVAVGVITAFSLAWLGAGHWALVGLNAATVASGTLAAWVLQPWRPGRPAPLARVRPLLGFGANILATRLVAQLVRGAPNALLGWMWGPAVTGLYQRAYALLMVAIDQIQSPIASVVLPPLSRVQDRPAHLRPAFLDAYRIVVSLILPAVVTGAIFAEEFIALLLGARWGAAAPVFRWLALGGVLLAVLSPQGLLLLALGRAGTCTRLAALDAAGAVAGFLLGLRHGAAGVALGFVGAKLVLVVPLTWLSFRHTPVAWHEAVRVIREPLAAAAATALGGLGLKLALAPHLTPAWLAIAGGGLSLALYAALLLGPAGQGSFYLGLLRELRAQRSPAA